MRDMSNEKSGIKRGGGLARRRRTAYHEAGHAVLGVIFDKEIAFVKFTNDESHEFVAFVRFPNSQKYTGAPRIAFFRRMMEVQILIDFAGVVAEFMRVRPKLDDSAYGELIESQLLDDAYGEGDYARITEYIGYLLEDYNPKNEALHWAYERYLLETARQIVSEPEVTAAIRNVAEIVISKDITSGEEIYAACGRVQGFDIVADRYRRLYLPTAIETKDLPGRAE